jgi:predicted PolB exonuclease-like 3'-5' exonuclease
MAFAIFDIETRTDKSLLNRTFFPGMDLDDEEAFRRFAADIRGGFMPTSLHVPISIAIGDVGDDHVLRSVESLPLENYSEEKLVREFWARVDRFPGTLVSFNGRRFDLPVLELAALRHGIAAPNYFAGPDSPRRRYTEARHIDLFEFLGNQGAANLRGGLNLLLKMIGMPGKTDANGARVQEMFDAGQLAQIHRYCRSDVIQTYFLFIRAELMRGRLEPGAYEHARASAFSRFADVAGPGATG